MTTVFTRDTLVKGQPVRVPCVDVAGQIYALSRGPRVVARLEDEWYEDVSDPEAVIAGLKTSGARVDLLTFWQRLPDVQARFQFHTEWEAIAALPIKSFDYWWNTQIKSRTRTLIRKAQNAGVVVREAEFDDAFVRGITSIFNETPLRQGRRFWHYGKDAATVKAQFSRYLFREHLIGAYYRDELIGFVILGNAGRYAVTNQIISKIAHRDKAITNLLIAKTVELCEKQGFPHLVYLHWGSGSLAEFKRRCGFEEVRVPRYYVPLTQCGTLALRLGLHRDWKSMLPSSVMTRLKQFRSTWLQRVHYRGQACQESRDS